MITKRMVGLGLVMLGLSSVVAVIGVDLIGAGNWDGLGPAQQLAMLVGAAVSLVGLSLIPLGDRPA